MFLVDRKIDKKKKKGLPALCNVEVPIYVLYYILLCSSYIIMPNNLFFY